MALYKVKLCATKTADRDAILRELGSVLTWPDFVNLGAPLLV